MFSTFQNSVNLPTSRKQKNKIKFDMQSNKSTLAEECLDDEIYIHIPDNVIWLGTLNTDDNNSILDNNAWLNDIG